MLDVLRFEDDWTLTEDLLGGLEDRTAALFTTSNGYLGLRGRDDEPFGREADSDMLVLGCYETRPYAHPETSYGVPERYQTIVGVTDPWALTITIDATPMTPSSGTWLERSRRLDLRTGCITTSGTWRSPSGATVEVQTRRMASVSTPNLLWSELALTTDTAVDAEVTIETRANIGSRTFPDEPEALSRAWGRVWHPRLVRDGRDGPAGLVHTTVHSGRAIACATAVVGPERPTEVTADDDTIVRRYRISASPGQSLSWTQRAAFVDGPADAASHLLEDAARIAATAGGTFTAARDRQREKIAVFWEAADVEIDGDAELERAVRFSTFQVYQATACPTGGWSPAKGLTGQGYEGHHLWEHETYIGHALGLLLPDAARAGLAFRCHTLPEARRRAGQLSHRGAQYPWRTIDGSEASAFFPAGAAQHHVNADIAWAIERYVECTGDESLLADGAIDVLVETARFWMSLGRFDEEERFRIEGVTGPDEYTALVDNNTYTNLMAAANLRSAADRVDALATDDRTALTAELSLEPDEPATWRRAADAVVVPYDDERGVHAQDDAFLRLPVWDLAATPADELPLQDHHHLLTLYRHQVLKQADVVLAQFLLPDQFTPDQHRRNYDYYEPLTTHDSSLSAPIHAIVGADVGHLDRAMRYLRDSATIDLADDVGSLGDGLHLAAAAGTWLAVACGFGGFRVRDGVAAFRPQLPPGSRRLRFRLRFRATLLDVAVDADSCTYGVVDGEAITVLHDGDPIRVVPGGSVRCAAVASAANRSGRSSA